MNINPLEVKLMAETKEIIIALVGYVIAFISPIIGLIVGAVIFYTQKDKNPFLKKHGKFIIFFAIAMWIISIILVMLGIFPSF